MPKFLDEPQWYGSDGTLLRPVGSSMGVISNSVLVGGYNGNCTWYTAESFAYINFCYSYTISSTTDVSFSTSFIAPTSSIQNSCQTTSDLSITLYNLGFDSQTHFISATGSITFSPISTDSNFVIYGLYGTNAGTVVAVYKNLNTGLQGAYTSFSRYEDDATVTSDYRFIRAMSM